MRNASRADRGKALQGYKNEPADYSRVMGYTHYWAQRRAFTEAEWALILGEAKRIVAKAQRGGYRSGGEEAASPGNLQLGEPGMRSGFHEKGAPRAFPSPEAPVPPRQGAPILLAGPRGRGKPRLNEHLISLNGIRPHDCESFVLGKEPPTPYADRQDADAFTGFCKTEHRPYDAAVVSILAAARAIAPEAIEVSSDGGEQAIRYLF
jgi:hypothetical protein